MPFNATPDWPRPERPDRDGHKLHALTKVRLTDEGMSAMRLVFVSVLAVIGGGAWLELVCPTLLPEGMRVSIPELWRAACIVVLIAVALEWTWYRRRARHFDGVSSNAAKRSKWSVVTNCKRRSL